MTARVGTVRADGTSSLLPRGVVDLSAMNIEVSEEVRKAAEAALASLDPQATQAKYKLEILLKGGPRRTGEVAGVVCVWTNGGYLAGGGDAFVHLCPTQEAGSCCLAPLDMEQDYTHRGAYCRRCGRHHAAADLISTVVWHQPLTRWGAILEALFHRLGCDADLLLAIDRESLMKATRMETGEEGNRHGEAYAQVVRKRDWIAYPLVNIIKDTASGATLSRRLQAFLEA